MRDVTFAAVVIGGAVVVAVLFVVWVTPGDFDRRVSDWFASHCTHTYRFDPKPDITTDQLAQILAHASVSRPICENAEHPIPEDLKSQLREIK